MSHSWFIFADETVTGPFDTEQVRVQLATGQLPPASFIWWKGQREWIPVSTWESQLPTLLNQIEGQSQKPIWYMDSCGTTLGPLTQSELIENLKLLPQMNRVHLWAVGMPKWTNIYELHEIMELLGISRREHARAPLMGTVAVSRSTDDPKGYVLQAASISIGGMGLKGGHDLRKGDNVSMLLNSPELGGNIHLRGEVAYVTRENYAGIRFQKVPPETQTIIIDYVKRFNIEAGKVQAA